MRSDDVCSLSLSLSNSPCVPLLLFALRSRKQIPFREMRVSVCVCVYVCVPSSQTRFRRVILSSESLFGEFADDADEGAVLVAHLADVRAQQLHHLL